MLLLALLWLWAGLLYDREWVLTSLTGEILTQKKVKLFLLSISVSDQYIDVICKLEVIRDHGNMYFKTYTHYSNRLTLYSVYVLKPSCFISCFNLLEIDFQVPEMYFISTFVDLNIGILFVESPCCKGRLPIKLMPDSDNSVREEINVHGQRWVIMWVIMTASCFLSWCSCKGLSMVFSKFLWNDLE